LYLGRGLQAAGFSNIHIYTYIHTYKIACTDFEERFIFSGKRKIRQRNGRVREEGIYIR
jgi:hypothetical protein